MISRDRAEERPDVPALDAALISEPFFNFRDNLLSSTAGTLSQLGRLSLAKRTLVTIALDVSCVILKHNICLSL